MRHCGFVLFLVIRERLLWRGAAGAEHSRRRKTRARVGASVASDGARMLWTPDGWTSFRQLRSAILCNLVKHASWRRLWNAAEDSLAP